MAKIGFIDPRKVIIRGDRQRKSFTIEDILPSVKEKGVFTAIVLNENHELIAGERRVTAAIEAGCETVPYVMFDDLSPIEQEEIELEENVKRKDLTWQDHAQAVFRLHQRYASQSADPDSYPKEATSKRLGYSSSHGGKLIDLGEAITEGDKSVSDADQMSKAWTIFERRRQRTTADAIAKLMETAKKPSAEVPIQAVKILNEEKVEGQLPLDLEVKVAVPEAPFKILHANAIDFFQNYSGDRFNFLHCDLPYGVELHGQANQDSFEEGYDSNPEIYWELCEAIANGWNNVMFPSSHIMFWFAFMGNDGEGFYDETKRFFEQKVPGLRLQRNPIVWMKTDNRGILADARRGPRNICEFAFIGATEDRFIVKPVANAYGAPTNKAGSIHTNEKPIPVLNHFFQMFVDDNTRIIDPTAGSGSAIRAAEGLGAELGLGLEFNEELAGRAQRKLESERGLRALAKKAEQK